MVIRMLKDDRSDFLEQRLEHVKKLKADESLKAKSKEWVVETSNYKYSYNFDWLGVPIIQYPQDIVALQEIIWRSKPDVIVETGVARGGSLVFSASMLKLLNNGGKVIGIDIDIRPHNRQAIESHPLAGNINLVSGSSVDDQTFSKVLSLINSEKKDQKIMVILDSNHTYEHVLNELKIYSELVTKDCYLVVMDTVVDEMPDGYYQDRPWGKNNNPKTAVHEFLKNTDSFIIDKSIDSKLLVTMAPDGYLKRIK